MPYISLRDQGFYEPFEAISRGIESIGAGRERNRKNALEDARTKLDAEKFQRDAEESRLRANVLQTELEDKAQARVDLGKQPEVIDLGNGERALRHGRTVTLMTPDPVTTQLRMQEGAREYNAKLREGTVPSINTGPRLLPPVEDLQATLMGQAGVQSDAPAMRAPAPVAKPAPATTGVPPLSTPRTPGVPAIPGGVAPVGGSGIPAVRPRLGVPEGAEPVSPVVEAAGGPGIEDDGPTEGAVIPPGTPLPSNGLAMGAPGLPSLRPGDLYVVTKGGKPFLETYQGPNSVPPGMEVTSWSENTGITAKPIHPVTEPELVTRNVNGQELSFWRKVNPATQEVTYDQITSPNVGPTKMAIAQSNLESAKRYAAQLRQDVIVNGAWSAFWEDPAHRGNLDRLLYNFAVTYTKTFDPDGVVRNEDVKAVSEHVIPLGVLNKREVAIVAIESILKDLDHKARGLGLDNSVYVDSPFELEMYPGGTIYRDATGKLKEKEKKDWEIAWQEQKEAEIRAAMDKWADENRIKKIKAPLGSGATNAPVAAGATNAPPAAGVSTNLPPIRPPGYRASRPIFLPR